MDFILSDESVNSYGFKVLTRGINLKKFLQNPVMYYNHNQEDGVIGRWEDIRISGTKLLARPVFDLNDPLGAKIAKKVEDGFIKGASITIANADLSEVNGDFVVISSEIVECSVCDIPSNGNALKLFIDNKPVNPNIGLLKLSATKNANLKEQITPILNILGLSHSSSVEDIISEIKALKQEDNVDSVISEAIRLNLVAKDDRENLLQMAKSSPDAFKSFIGNKKAKLMEDRLKEADSLLLLAFRDGRVDADGQGKIREGWLQLFNHDFDQTKMLLENLPKRASASSLMASMQTGSNGESREGWTLNDYRKKDPKALKNNPALFQRLIALEK